MDVVIAGAVRTAIGTFGGGLKDIHVSELGATVLAEALKRANVEAAAIEADRQAAVERLLHWYLGTGEAMDKAGAYALQGEAVRFVTAVEGDRETVIGLPTRLVRRLLEGLGTSL